MSKQTPWPSAKEAAAATNPTPQSSFGNDIDADLESLAAALKLQKCTSIVVIGISDAGELIQMRRPGENPNSYAIIGALEVMKNAILTHEIVAQSSLQSPEPNPQC